MTQMTAMVRDRLQDRMISWQEKRFRKAQFRQQQADIHRSRMTCSASLSDRYLKQDWTGGMTQSGAVPVIKDPKPRQRLISSDGIRWDAAIAALIVIAVILTAVLAADLAHIGNGSRAIRKLNASIVDLEEGNSDLQQQIEMNSDSASVCTEAVRLNLISSNGAKTIRLTAPTDAQMTLSTAETAAENAEIETKLTSFAGD